MNKIVILGYPGIGKTTLQNMMPDKVIDMEIRNYKYENYDPNFTLEEWYSIEHIVKSNYMEEYIESIKEEIKNGNHEIIFVWLTQKMIDYLIKENIDFVVATWNEYDKNIKEYLQKLYEKRGKPKDWGEKAIYFLEPLNTKARLENLGIIVLNSGENISMKIDEIKNLLKEQEQIKNKCFVRKERNKK